jgi:hypothetical protein
MTNDPFTTYFQNRERLLADITQALTADERFVAAWLTGSFGRDEADAISDLDLTVIVADPHSEHFCARPWQTGARTTPERWALFSQFGQPVVIHENHHNAPEGGAFTFVLYGPSALMIDWVLLPHARAQCPSTSRLLFDKVGVPHRPPSEPESLPQRQEKVSERMAFFWMMAAVTAKYAIRRDCLFVQCWLDNLQGIIGEVERLMAGRAPTYQRGSRTTFEATHEGQLQALRRLCERMLELMSEATKMGWAVPASPMSTLKILFTLANSK